MKKIDLHLHTQKCKNGDSTKRNINPSDFVIKMEDNNIGICSITNHNKFDLDEYNSIIEKKHSFAIFPGIELDIKLDSGEEKHIILICDPECANEFRDIFSSEENRNCDEHMLEYKMFIKKVKGLKKNQIIIIPHFLDKDKVRSLNEVQKNTLRKDLCEYTIILEPKLKSMGIINAHNELSLIGSDIIDWDKYKESADRLPEIKFLIDSFKKFYELASNPKLFIKTVLDNCEKVDVEIENSTNKISIYQDVNVIFGGKGAGKTQLLKSSILPKFNSIGKKVIIHEGKDYQTVYDKALDGVKSKVEIDVELKQKIINSFNHILEYKEEHILNFVQKFTKYHQSERKNKNANLIKKTDSIYAQNCVNQSDDILSVCRENIRSINKVSSINTNNRKDVNKHKKTLSDELNILKREITEKTLNDLKLCFSINKTNKLLSNIKGSVSKKTGQVAKPNNIGFAELISRRLKVLMEIKATRHNLHHIENTTKIKIGFLPDKGEIFVKASIRVLKYDETWETSSPFTRKGIDDNRKFIEKITNFRYKNFTSINSFFNDDLNSTGEDYFVNCVRVACDVIKGNSERYEPSEGEKSILSITSLIEDFSYDCYLFDEIERGLGNKYISEYIIPQINHLRDIGKTIILSTHNANIAISTLPTQTILCNYIGDSNGDIYYVGNMYSNELVPINKNSESINWDEISLKHLEGSKELFKRRSNIWNIE